MNSVPHPGEHPEARERDNNGEKHNNEPQVTGKELFNAIHRPHLFVGVWVGRAGGKAGSSGSLGGGEGIVIEGTMDGWVVVGVAVSVSTGSVTVVVTSIVVVFAGCSINTVLGCLAGGATIVSLDSKLNTINVVMIKTMAMATLMIFPVWSWHHFLAVMKNFLFIAVTVPPVESPEDRRILSQPPQLFLS